MARHDRIAPFFGEGIYFAYPASPWLRGSNENANGLLRQYLPKRTDLSIHDAASLQRIEDRLNGRPRKRLGWTSPSQAFITALAGS